MGTAGVMEKKMESSIYYPDPNIHPGTNHPEVEHAAVVVEPLELDIATVLLQFRIKIINGSFHFIFHYPSISYIHP